MLISLLVLLVVLGLVYWCAHRLATAFGLPAPIIVLIDVVIVIVAVVLLLRILGLEIGGLR
jgi:hypothetical protein